MKTVSVNGIDIAYQESGSGPPLLLLHGFSLDHTIWAPQVETLPKELPPPGPRFARHGAHARIRAGPYRSR